MTYARLRHPLNLTYLVKGKTLKRVTEVKDLGTLFDAQLSFNPHIEKISNEARRCLGFVIRQARLFNSQHAISILYNAYVRSKLETNAVVWNPHEQQYTLLLEKVQKSFIRFQYKKTYGYYPLLYPSLFLLGMVNYVSLEARRSIYLIKYFFQLIRGLISNPQLLAQIPLRVPRVSSKVLRPRRRDLFAVPPSRTRALASSPLHQALKLLNDILESNSQLDIFFTSESRFLTASYHYLESIVTPSTII